MMSAFGDQNYPVGTPPEGMDPSMWDKMRANAGDAMKDPRSQVAMAMLMQQMAKAGQNLAGGPPSGMRRPQMNMPGFDIYGNPIS